MQVVVMRHRGVRCAIPVSQVEVADREPGGAMLALWDGHPVPAGGERVRHLRVRTGGGPRWIAASDVRHARVSERIDVPVLLSARLVPAHVVALARVEHAEDVQGSPNGSTPGELVWLADCARLEAEHGG